MYKFKTKCNKFEEGVYEPFVYIIQEVSTGKYYIGSKTAIGCRRSDLGEKYFTSSKLIKDVWFNNNTAFRIIEVHPCESNHHALLLEMALIKTCDAVRSDEFINIGHCRVGFNMSGRTDEDNHFFGKKHSKESLRKMSSAQKSMFKKECPHCRRKVKATVYPRWHGNRCPWKGCTKEEIDIVNEFTSQQLARRKLWYRSWCEENPEKVKYFTLFDYLRASLNGMTRIYLAFEEKQNENRVSH